MFYPIKFHPVYKDYLWGGRNLEKLGRNLPDGIIAESWEVSAHPDGVSVVKNGIYAGWSLPRLLSEFGREIIGKELEEECLQKFPILVKLIDANQKLSVQVHPGDTFARQFENGEFGKTEMWYIISAKPGSEIIYDLKPGITREIFQKAIEQKKVEDCLQSQKVSAGDVVYIPSGIIHALGEGIVLAEIQQNSNATYRVYDYERVDAEGNQRMLHIQKALDVIRFNHSKNDINAKGLELKTGPDVSKTIISANRYFAVELYRVNGGLVESANGDRFAIYTFIHGDAVIHYGHDSMEIKSPESLLIPATLGDYRIEGEFTALKTYVPNLEKGIIMNLEKEGFSKTEIMSSIPGLSEIAGERV